MKRLIHILNVGIFDSKAHVISTSLLYFPIKCKDYFLSHNGIKTIEWQICNAYNIEGAEYMIPFPPFLGMK